MVQKMMGQGIGSMLSGGGSGGGSSSSTGIHSMLSGLVGGGGGLNRDHELVRHVNKMLEYKIQRRLDDTLNKEWIY